MLLQTAGEKTLKKMARWHVKWFWFFIKGVDYDSQRYGMKCSQQHKSSKRYIMAGLSLWNGRLRPAMIAGGNKRNVTGKRLS